MIMMMMTMSILSQFDTLVLSTSEREKTKLRLIQLFFVRQETANKETGKGTEKKVRKSETKIERKRKMK